MKELDLPLLDLASDAYRADPYAVFRELREQSPVVRVLPFGFYAATRYDDVVKILRDTKTFSSVGQEEAFPKVPGLDYFDRGPTMVRVDPPEHTRLRGLVANAFRPTTIARLETKIQTISRRLIQEIGTSGAPFDLIQNFAIPLPVIVISELLGIEASEQENFKRWSDDLISVRGTHLIKDESSRKARQAELIRSGEEMNSYFEAIIKKRQREPQADLISDLIAAQEAGQRLSSDEVLAMCRLLLIAGNETTTNLIGNTFLALTKYPDELKKVIDTPSLVTNLVEESLRYDSPVLSLFRRTTEATSIAGVPLAQGQVLMPLVGSANRDPRRFPQPEHFDVTRDASGHVAFGFGIHFCLGAPLARLEARVAFHELFAAYQDFFLDSERPLTRIDSFSLRGPKRLFLRAIPADKSTKPRPETTPEAPSPSPL